MHTADRAHPTWPLDRARTRAEDRAADRATRRRENRRSARGILLASVMVLLPASAFMFLAAPTGASEWVHSVATRVEPPAPAPEGLTQAGGGGGSAATMGIAADERDAGADPQSADPQSAGPDAASAPLDAGAPPAPPVPLVPLVPQEALPDDETW